jgi:hypothetical protein
LESTSIALCALRKESPLAQGEAIGAQLQCCVVGGGILQLRVTERLIGRALAGNPPPDIADELWDLLLDGVYY